MAFPTDREESRKQVLVAQEFLIEMEQNLALMQTQLLANGYTIDIEPSYTELRKLAQQIDMARLVHNAKHGDNIKSTL
jgi:hypothetical protein